MRINFCFPGLQVGQVREQIFLRTALPRRAYSEGFADGIHRSRVSLAGGSLDGLHRLMEKLVNQASGQRLDGGLLLWGKALQAARHAAQFRSTNLLRGLLQLHNLRRHIQRVQPALILGHLGQDHRFGHLCLFAALFQVRSGNRLQVINVVEKDAVQLVDFRIDVARHRDVDKEHGPPTPLLQKVLRVLAAKDRPRRAGGGDDDVGLVRAGVEVVKADRLCPQTAGPAVRRARGCG